MAYEKTGETIPGLVAGADLSAAQYHFVKMSGDATVVLCGDGEAAIGVLQNKPVSGEECTVWAAGTVTKMRVGVAGALTAGDAVACDANGEAETAGVAERIRGYCLVGGGVGELATVYLENDGVA